MTNTPSPDDRELIERLKLHAKRSSEASKIMAQSKSLRQAHDPPRDDLYMWAAPEQTIEWQAADRLESLLADRAKLEEALKPFADCCDQIEPEEDDEEWAKFRLLIKDYRRARDALNRSADRG